MRIEFNLDNFFIVPINQVRPNDWNPKDKETEKQKNIQRGLELKGLLEPIVVREKPDANNLTKYEILDGEQRWTSLKNLGMDEIAIHVVDVDDITAKEITLEYQVQVPWNEKEYANFVKKASKLVDIKELELPETEDRLLDLIQLADYDFEKALEQKEVDKLLQEEMKTLNFDVDKEQYEIIMDALTYIMNNADEKKMKIGPALEFLLAEYRAM